MSKTLIIVRHAKSSWSQPNTADIDRPLKKRGYRDAQHVGAWLKQYCNDNGITAINQLISPASRTQLTAKIITESLEDIATDSTVIEDMYLAGLRTLVDIILKQPDSVNCIALYGHNPGVHELTEYYSAKRIEKFPTCAAACFQFDSDSWLKASSSSCEDFQLIKPKSLR